MTLKSQTANMLARIPAFEPAIRGRRAAKTPEYLVRSLHDDRHLMSVLAAALRRSSNAVDVGASEGLILKDIVRIASEGHHVAFEPNPKAYAALRSRFPEVDVRSAATSDQAGTADFTIVTNEPTLSGLQPREWPHSETVTETITVVTERLDDVIHHPLALIKIDVEGTEAQTLRGAQRLLSEYRPVVAIEHGATIPGDPTDKDHREVWELLTCPGLRVFTIDGDGPLSAEEFSVLSASGSMWNFIAS